MDPSDFKIKITTILPQSHFMYYMHVYDNVIPHNSLSTCT
jgi:hypothetical protein